MPKYLVGTDRNHYSSKPLDFHPDMVVTADSPYSLPQLVEPFEPSDDQNIELAREIALWIDETWTNQTKRNSFNLWEIWTSKTVVTDMDGNVIYGQKPGGPIIQPDEPPPRRVLNRG